MPVLQHYDPNLPIKRTRMLRILSSIHLQGRSKLLIRIPEAGHDDRSEKHTIALPPGKIGADYGLFKGVWIIIYPDLLEGPGHFLIEYKPRCVKPFVPSLNPSIPIPEDRQVDRVIRFRSPGLGIDEESETSVATMEVKGHASSLTLLSNPTIPIHIPRSSILTSGLKVNDVVKIFPIGQSDPGLYDLLILS